MTSIPTIEQLWQALRNARGGTLQRRVDATHPHDLYVDFEAPSRPGLIAVCANRPPGFRPLRAVTVEHGRRADGRWSLRLSLDEPRLLPVFASLCRDIVSFTRTNISEAQLAAAVLGRLDHWRILLEKDTAGLGELSLRGLIGELLVLEEDVLGVLQPAEAVAAWTGPLGTPQDFQLPSGRRIEVKAVRRDARIVRINGLDQLDPGADTLVLAIVRIDETGGSAPGAITAPMLIDRVRSRITSDPEALATFNTSLGFLGWYDHPLHHDLAVRLVAIERHDVGPGFPRLTVASVPAGIEDADYAVVLPVLT